MSNVAQVKRKGSKTQAVINRIIRARTRKAKLIPMTTIQQRRSVFEPQSVIQSHTMEYT